MWRTTVALAALIVLKSVSIYASAATNTTNDACRERLPSSLIAAIPKSFPGLRAPLEADNLQEDIAYSRAHGGNGCVSVATANFDGMNPIEYLIGLSANRGGSGLAIIARENDGKWLFHKLEEWPSNRDRLYVDVARPGRYVHTDALDGLSTDERSSLHCRYSGAVIGETESAETVYCVVYGKWLHVQIAD